MTESRRPFGKVSSVNLPRRKPACQRNVQALAGLADAQPAKALLALVQSVAAACTLRRRRRSLMRSASHSSRSGNDGKRDYSQDGRQHAARPYRQRPARLLRLRQSARRARLDRAVPRRRDDGRRAARNIPTARAARRRPTRLPRAIDELEGSAGTILVPSGLAAVTIPLLAFLSAGDHVLIVDSVYHPDPQFRRHDAEAARRRGRILRSAGRRRHRDADEAQHQGRVHRIARLQHIRDAGHSGHRAGRQQPWRGRHDGQHLGDAALFPAARPWRRHLDPRGDQISRRPFRHRCIGTVSANAAHWKQLYDTFITMGCCCRPRRCLPDAARPADHGRAPRAAPAKRA